MQCSAGRRRGADTETRRPTAGLESLGLHGWAVSDNRSSAQDSTSGPQYDVPDPVRRLRRDRNVRISVSPSPIHLAESMGRGPVLYKWPDLHRASRRAPTPTESSAADSQERHDNVRLAQANRAGSRVGSVASKRFRLVFRRVNVGFQTPQAPSTPYTLASSRRCGISSSSA